MTRTKKGTRGATSRVTSYDVAELAGVSQAAVSRVYRPGASASEAMREKVLAAAKELGYRPNAIARGLSTQRSNMVALIMFRQTNLDYPDTLVELTSSLSREGIRALLFSVEQFGELSAVVEQILQYQVDGVIMGGPMTAAQRKVLDKAGIPVIFYGGTPPDRPFNAVDCDNDEGTGWLVDQLVDAGHQTFGLMAGPESGRVAVQRAEFFLGKLRERGFDDVISVSCGYDYQEARSGFAKLMNKMRTKPDAVIAVTDSLAIASIDEARGNFGLDVPEDISITGFDGVRISGFQPYNLTTVRLPRRRMAEAAVTMLLEHIENPDLPPELRTFSGVPVTGNSLGPAKNK